MSYPATLTDTELSAVNTILVAAGQAPITTLDETNPDVDIVYSTLVAVNREVQAEGWSFNRELEYLMPRDTNNEIIVPSNVIQINVSRIADNAGVEVVPRDGKLYNKTDHTYQWERDVKCDVLWLFPFVDTPQVIKDLVTARAALVAVTSMVGDREQYTLLQQREARAQANAAQYESEQGRYSMFGFPTGNNFYTSYQPFNTLSR